MTALSPRYLGAHIARHLEGLTNSNLRQVGKVRRCQYPFNPSHRNLLRHRSLTFTTRKKHTAGFSEWLLGDFFSFLRNTLLVLPTLKSSLMAQESSHKTHAIARRVASAETPDNRAPAAPAARRFPARGRSPVWTHPSVRTLPFARGRSPIGRPKHPSPAPL
jgi:hypothetical protein